MKKSQILEILRDEPEDLDFDRFMYTLHFRRKMEIALADADAGREISQEELVRLTDEWLV